MGRIGGRSFRAFLTWLIYDRGCGMPRLARLDAPGVLHHVMGRGIERKRKFFMKEYFLIPSINLPQKNSNSLVAFAYTNVEIGEAVELINNNGSLIIVDVRELGEFCDVSGHILCSINYPYNSGVFDEKYDELPVNGDILIVCRSGNRRSKASQFLFSKGYLNVYNMLGGMNAWTGETVSCGEDP